MAIVLAPLSSWDARNKFGPLQVFSGWRTLPTVRANVVPTNPRTVGQSGARSILTLLSQAWGGLTAGQVSAWRDWANGHEYKTSLGQEFRGTGLNAFVELNSPIEAWGGTFKTSPPVDVYESGFGAFLADTGAGGAGTMDLTWDVPAGATANDKVRVDVTSAMPNEHRLPQKSDWRVNQYVNGSLTGVQLTGLTPDAWYWTRGRWYQEDGQYGAIIYSLAQAHS